MTINSSLHLAYMSGWLVVDVLKKEEEEPLPMRLPHRADVCAEEISTTREEL